MKPNSITPRPKKEGCVFVATVDDFYKKSQISVRIMGKPVSVFADNSQTAFFAREMSCKHQGADLSAMPIKDNKVTCSRHGWRYDLSTGECENANSPSLREHEVYVEEGNVFVSLFPLDR